eukprot:13764014-Alexandrium_andersonii.AAC.1
MTKEQTRPKNDEGMVNVPRKLRAVARPDILTQLIEMDKPLAPKNDAKGATRAGGRRSEVGGSDAF